MGFRYFEVLGLPRQFSLDADSLSQIFRAKSIELHPDKNKGKDTTATFAELNKAYRTLRDPWARALYLLEQMQISLDRSTPPVSLAEAFFALEEEGNPHELKALQAKIEAEGKALAIRLEQAFLKADQEGLTKDNLKTLHDLVLEHTYREALLRNISERLKP